MTNHSIKVDVVVVGAGSAGVAAACAASNSGASTLLIERNTYPGGKATAAMVGTVCGLFLNHRGDEVKWAVSGFARNFAEALASISGSRPEKFYDRLFFLPYQIDAFKELCRAQLCDAGVKCLWGAELKSVLSTDDRIDRIIVQNDSEQWDVSARCIIDCSGNALVSQLVGTDWVDGGENQAAARVFKLSNIPDMPVDAIHFALSLSLRRGVGQGQIPEDYQMLSVVPGSYQSGSAYFKLPLPETVSNNPDQRDEMVQKSEGHIQAVVKFLTTETKSFAGVRMTEMAEEVGFRTGFRSIGRARLEEEDVLSARKTSDGIANGAWPIEFWKPGSNVEMAFFEENAYYHIPAGCLESEKAKNLYFAGRNLSASPRAMASARVMGTCLQTGYAAGVLAAYNATGRGREEAIEKIREELQLG